MTGLINAEAFSYIHRDFHHNILFDDHNYQAYIIDLDSVQYANYPPTAQSAENRSCLPAKYTIRGRYYSTVELSYWAGMMAIASIILPNPRRGTCIIDAGEEKGTYKINKERYTELHKKAPHIADMAVWQYDDCFPCHPMRILEAVERDESRVEFKSVFSNLYVYFDKEVPNQTHSKSYEEPDVFRGDYVYEIPQGKNGYSGGGTKEFAASNENAPNEYDDVTKVYQNVKEKDTVTYSLPKKSGTKSETKNDNAVSIVSSEDKKPKKSLLDNKYVALIIKWFKIIVVTIFKKSIGTISVSVDTDLPQEELYEDQYKILINNKLWKKPLIASIVIIGITVGLLIVSSLL